VTGGGAAASPKAGEVGGQTLQVVSPGVGDVRLPPGRGRDKGGRRPARWRIAWARRAVLLDRAPARSARSRSWSPKHLSLGEYDWTRQAAANRSQSTRAFHDFDRRSPALIACARATATASRTPLPVVVSAAAAAVCLGSRPPPTSPSLHIAGPPQPPLDIRRLPPPAAFPAPLPRSPSTPPRPAPHSPCCPRP